MKQKLNIEIKKFTLKNLLISGYTMHDIITKLLEESLQLYNADFPAPSFLKECSEYILAYLQLGFSYLDHQNLFDFILTEAGYCEQKISHLRTRNKTVYCSKAQIRSIIDKWPASPYNSHTITEAVNDIILHVSNNDCGEFVYFTAKKDGEYTALYQLLITPEYALFHNVFRNQFYTLMKK